MSGESRPLLHSLAMLVCSFCGKDQDHVRKLIAGPKVFICDECVDLCNDILEAETAPFSADAARDSAESTAVGPNLFTPRVVTRYVDEAVRPSSAAAVDTIYWICEGCGWKLGLKPARRRRRLIPRKSTWEPGPAHCASHLSATSFPHARIPSGRE